MELAERSPEQAAGVETKPRRVMGFADVALFYVVTGISLRWSAFGAVAGPAAIVMWLSAFFLFYIPLALCVLEMSSRYPHQGGLYVWTKSALGDFAAFMAGWTYWASTIPFFPGALYFAAASSLFLFGDVFKGLGANPSFFVLFSLGALALMAFLNVIGLNVGKWLHNVGAVGMCVGAFAILAIGLVAFARFGSAAHFDAQTLTPHVDVKSLIVWATLTFAFAGSETASFMAEEIKEPRKTLPLALLFGGAIITIGYIGGTLSILVTLPAHLITGLEGFMRAVSLGADRIGAPGITPVTAIFVAASEIGACGAFLAAMARLAYVAGIEHYLPSSFAKLHPKWGTPYIALIAYAVLGGVFALIGQAGTSVKTAYDILVSLTIVTYFIPFIYLFLSMMKLQATPAPTDGFRVPGGRPVALALASIGLTMTILVLVLSFVPEPDDPTKALTLVKTLGSTAFMVVLGAVLFKWRHRNAVKPHAA
jgi:amino acid transporter